MVYFNLSDDICCACAHNSAPFQHTDGRQHHYSSAHGVYIFPGVALGAVMSRCTRLREDMFVAAAQTVAAMVTEKDRTAGRVFPAVSRAREIAAQVAKAVAGKGYDAGIATELPKPHDLLHMAKRAMYYPGVHGRHVWHGVAPTHPTEYRRYR